MQIQKKIKFELQEVISSSDASSESKHVSDRSGR